MMVLALSSFFCVLVLNESECSPSCPVKATGQATCYDLDGIKIECSGTGQDGDLRPGVPWPRPRFADNDDGTITDHLTGLVWLKKADCLGALSWQDALKKCSTLASGMCGLTNGSRPGDWRMPSILELQSLLSKAHPLISLPDRVGTGHWSEGDPFTSVRLGYWSSTSYSPDPADVWLLDMRQLNGSLWHISKRQTDYYIYTWPLLVRRDERAPPTVRATGQIECHDAYGKAIDCKGTGQDGDTRPGVAWPIPRFKDNGNGTVTDCLTGLVWLKDPTCPGVMNWEEALRFCRQLAAGKCGLRDSSNIGDWRLPSVNELESLVDLRFSKPCLANTSGQGQWSENDPFSGADYRSFWSCTAFLTGNIVTDIYTVSFRQYGHSVSNKMHGRHGVWPLRNAD